MECQGGKEEWTYESRIRIYRLILISDMQSRDLSSVDYQVDILLVWFTSAFIQVCLQERRGTLLSDL